MRKLLTMVMFTTVAAAVGWTVITFFGDSTMIYTDMATNYTGPVHIPRLQIKAYYPWNPEGSSMAYFLTIGFQFYYLLFSMVHSNSSDVLFCSWVLFACEQLQHLKVSLVHYSPWSFHQILLNFPKIFSINKPSTLFKNTPFFSLSFPSSSLCIFPQFSSGLKDFSFSIRLLQGVMRPLMELSATLDTYRPNSAALFRSISAGSKAELILNEGL
jgi:hypothetical protein